MTAEINVSSLQRAKWVSNTIFHQVVAIVAVFIFSVFFNNFETSNKRLWHIFLSTCAYVPLMAEGIILLSDSNVWSQQLERTKKTWLHGIFLCTSTVAMSVGMIFEIVGRNEKGEGHFASNHSKTGLVSWILAMLSVILGLCSTYSQDFKNFVKPVVFRLIHNFIGIASYAIGITSLSLGLYIWGFECFVTDNQQQATVGLVGIIGIWSALRAFKSLYYQIKSILS